MKEQILALAVQSGFKLDWAILNCTGQFESFYHAAIESYKAELLKEVGEPVAFLHQWIEYHPYGDTVAGEPCSAITNDGKPFDKSDTVTTLFTSDQVAAAIAKVTKPLAEEIQRLQDEDNVPVRYYQPNGKGSVYAVYGSSSIDFVEELRNQITVLQEELRSRDDFIAMLQETQNNQLATAQEEIVYASKDSLRLLETVKYLRGIAERGEARQQSEDETVEQFVLGYVKKLENQLAKAEQRVAEACAELIHHHIFPSRMQLAILSGEWRKFVKEM